MGAKVSRYITISLLLAIVTLVSMWGQGCGQGLVLPGQSFFDAKGNGGGYGGSRSDGGNGGGYGGMEPSLVEEYSALQASSGQEPSGVLDINKNYFRFSLTENPCSSFVTWPLANFVNARIFRNKAQYFYQPDLCSPNPVSADPNQLKTTDFNRETLVYNNEILQFYGTAPTDLSAVRYFKAHCEVFYPPVADQAQTGVSVNVFVLNGVLRAEVFQGVYLNGKNTRYRWGPFESTVADSGADELYLAPNFSLRLSEINGSQAKGEVRATMKSGFLGESNMRCWRN